MTLVRYRFNLGEGQDENAIVTSTGQFVIAWDFGKVKKGFLDRYEIKKYEDHVVQDNFKFGDDKEIVSLMTCVRLTLSCSLFLLVVDWMDGWMSDSFFNRSWPWIITCWL